MTARKLATRTLPSARSLRCARVLAELRNVAFAARRTHLSQADFCAEIRSLEGTFGSALFNGRRADAHVMLEALDRALSRNGISREPD